VIRSSHPRSSLTGERKSQRGAQLLRRGQARRESLAVSYREQSGVDIRIARIFNTYGPKMDVDDGRVVSNFIAQALSGKPLTVYGDGSQTRSFCYVSDMVEALVRLMGSPAYTGPTNLGNPRRDPSSRSRASSRR